jgi:hypothetical protein
MERVLKDPGDLLAEEGSGSGISDSGEISEVSDSEEISDSGGVSRQANPDLRDLLTEAGGAAWWVLTVGGGCVCWQATAADAGGALAHAVSARRGVPRHRARCQGAHSLGFGVRG